MAALLAAACGGGGGSTRSSSGGGADAADRGHELYSEGRFDEAERELESVVSREPKNSFARRVLGRIYLLKGRNPKAAEQFLSYVTLARDEKIRVDAMAVQDLFWALYRMDDYTRASRAAGLLDDSVFAVKYGEMAKRGPPYTVAWREPPALLSFEGSGTASVRINRVLGRFAIDFGSGEIVLSRDLAKEAGVRIAGVPSPGVERDEQGIVETVDVGAAQVRNVPIVVSQVPGSVDGVLGVSFLSHFQTTYDLKRNRAVLRPAGSEKRPGDAWPLLFAGDRTLLTRARVDGIDTYVIVNPSARGIRFIPSQALLVEKARRMKASTATLERVDVGSLSIAVKDQTPERFPAGVDVAYGFMIGGILGEEAFRNRSVTFDFRDMKIVVE
jgi:hypothetical protein